MSHLLFIDDDLDLLTINKKYFTKKGYNVVILSDLSKLSNCLKENNFDCILLDIMMPQADGYKVLESIRTLYSIPVIFISGKILPSDKVKGLMLGAEDYLTKPYDFAELEARINVQIRRLSSSNSTLSAGNLIINLETHSVQYNNKDIHLSNREFELLTLLIRNINEIVTYEDISNALWHCYDPDDKKTIMVIASRLRKKLGDYEGTANAIESIRSKGYKYVK